MDSIKRKWIWLKRFRRRRGYGVHSPFAFDFLTYVVYEKGEYYAYRKLKKIYRKRGAGWNGHTEKCCKFLFRLANYVQPDIIRLYGRVEEDRIGYLTAGCTTATVCRDMGDERNPACPERHEEAERTELVVVGGHTLCAEWAVIAASVKPGRSVCVVGGIHDSPEALEEWKEVKMLPDVIVSFDLYDYGLLFYDSSKQRQHYIINF